MTRIDRPMPKLDGVSHDWIDVGGFRLHVALGGDPDAPPLLCTHGWPQHWFMWRKLIGPLSEHYRVICPDLRGFGWSDTPGHGYDPITFSDDLANLLGALGIERARVMGHDWGGMTSNFLAARHPERVERMVTLNIPPPWIKMSPRALLTLWRFWYQAMVSTPGLRSLVHRALAKDGPGRRWAIKKADWGDGAGPSYAAQFEEKERARAASALYRFALFKLEPRIMLGSYRDSRVPAPSLILFGADDVALRPSILEGAGDCFDDLEIEFVPGAGHFIAEERADVVAERALAFLA